MQESKITITNLYDSFNAFVKKLELWKTTGSPTTVIEKVN